MGVDATILIQLENVSRGRKLRAGEISLQRDERRLRPRLWDIFWTQCDHA